MTVDQLRKVIDEGREFLAQAERDVELFPQMRAEYEQLKTRYANLQSQLEMLTTFRADIQAN
jgi:cell shape-determining protein MreC